MSRISAASADSTGGTSYDEGGQSDANQGPNKGTDKRQIDGKATAEPGSDAPCHQTGSTYSRSAPLLKS